MTITEYINDGISKYGAQIFFDNVNNLWEDYEQTIKEYVLNEIFKHIKPSKIETIEDLAKLLNGNENGNELDNYLNIDVEDICRKNKWVICFPYSDDNFESRGIIDEEVGAWDGGYYKFVKKGDFYPDEDSDNTYHKAEYDTVISVSSHDVSAEWCNDKVHKANGKKYIWDYIVNNEKLPCAYFDIVDEDTDEDEIWAKCCVIDLSSLYE